MCHDMAKTISEIIIIIIHFDQMAKKPSQLSPKKAQKPLLRPPLK